MTAKNDTAFDPYIKWLGIRSLDRPPNHYTLLGLTLFESDEDAIAAAAERQMAHVRKYQNGPHSAESQHILNQLAAAKLCLLRVDQKTAYDQQLKARLSRRSASGGYDAGTAVNAASRKMVLRIALALTVLTMFAVSVWFAKSRRVVDGSEGNGDALVSLEEAEPQEAEILRDVAQAQVEVVDAEGEAPEEVGSQPGKLKMQNAATTSRVPSAETAPWELVQQRRPPQRPADKPGDPRTLAILQALFDRDLAGANKAHQALPQVAHDTAQRAEAERLYRWIFLVKRFWVAVEEAMADPALLGATIQLHDRPVTVTAMADEAITLKSASGETKQFATGRAAMDLDVATGLVRWRLGETSPKSDLIVGTVMMIDKQGDLGQAKNLLARAQPRGEPIEILFSPEQIYSAPNKPQLKPAPTDETPTLPDAVDKREGSEPSPPKSGSADGPPADAEVDAVAVANLKEENEAEPEESALPNPTKQLAPTETDRQRAKQNVLRIFESEYSKAKQDPAAMFSLAEQLLNHANRTLDDPAARFVLYEEARRLGIEVRSPELAAQALDALAHNFKVNSWELRLDLVDACSVRVRDPGGQLFLLNQCLVVIDHFLFENDFESIEPCLGFVQRIGRATKEPALKVYARNIRSKLIQIERWYGRTRPSFAVLVERPEDPDANRLVGEYICFGRQQFEAGLQHLAKGSDAQLEELAQQELGGLQTIAATADAWWALAESRKGPHVQAMRRHAVVLYARALPRLSGLTFETAEQRILEEQVSLVDGYVALSALVGTRWSVDWPSDEVWTSVHFKSDGDVVVASKGPTWHGRAHQIDGSVRFLSLDYQHLFLTVFRGNQLLTQEFDLKTGYLAAVGVGRPPKTGVRRSS